MKRPARMMRPRHRLFFYAGWFLCASGLLFAGQGVQRMLYTSPNMAFIEKTSGETVTVINDTSGTVATLQAAINNVRGTNANIVIVARLLAGSTYWVTNAGLVLGSQECVVASGATIKAASTAVTVPLVTISAGATNVSIAGGLLDGSGASINAIYAPAAKRVNIDKVTAQNCGLDCILLIGQGNTTYDNEMTVTRCEASGSPTHAGISIQNSTQTAVLDNYCHNNSAGIWLSCAWATVANNVCLNNTTGIDASGGDDNVMANNTCNNNATGIHAGASDNMIVSDALGTNSVAGIKSDGSGNSFLDNLFTGGNAVNFSSGGSGSHVIAYKTPLSASGQDYFYPPLINDQHTNLIVNGMGRTDVTNTSTTIDNVQSLYNSARSANPNNVIVLHLNGTFTVGATPLTLQSSTCVLLNGTIQINSATGASQAITGGTSPVHVSISGGVIDGGNLTGNNAIYIPSGATLQVDAMTLQNFGADNPRQGNSDVLRLTGGATPQLITRCLVNGGAARGIWLENSGVKRVVSDCESTAVNEDGVDCDASTSMSIVKFCYCHDLVRYGVFFEQSASHNLALGNICNNCGRDINIYNNSVTPRGDTAFNSVLCNSLLSNNGLRNGSTGTNIVQSSHNFLFNNTVINASISSEIYGVENYYSQNYLAGGSLSTAGTESFFNPPDVSSNSYVQDGNSGLAVVVQNAALNNGAAIIIAAPGGLGNDQWALIPTDSGYYRVVNKKSGLVMAVQGASLSAGASIVQFAFGSAKNDQWMPVSAGNGLYYFVNRLSGLGLDVTGASANATLDQQPYSGIASQQFRLPLVLALNSYTLSVNPGATNIVFGSNAAFTVSLTTNTGFSGIVNFGVTGLPANASATFSPASLAANGSSTLTVTTATNTPAGNYMLTINGTNGANIASGTVLLLISGTGANPGTLVWTGGGGNINWSTPMNWTNFTGGGYGPPGTANDLLFTNLATALASNLVNNVVNSDTTVNSLADDNTNNFQVTQIAPGSTLMVAGAKGIVIGAEADWGTNAVIYHTITGTGGALAVNNPAANLIVREYTAGATGGPQRATLDLSGLDNFAMTGNSIGVGFFGGAGTARAAGTLYLAQANVLNLFMVAKGGTTNAGIDIADNPQANSSQNSFVFLGQQNAIYTDGITVGGGRNIGWLGFNPGFTNSAVYIRGTNGTASRVTRWLVADNSGASNTGSNSRGTNDFTGGTIDALADLMIIGRGESPTMGTGNSTGVVTITGGTMDVNNLQLGVQVIGAVSGSGTTYLGMMNVNGGLLIVNSNLTLAVFSNSTASVQGILNVNGGTVRAASITNAGGISAINLNSGTLDSQGGKIINVATLNVGSDGVPDAALLENAASVSVSNAIVIAANGTIAGNTFFNAPGLIVDGLVSPGVGMGVGAITNSGGITLGAGGNLAITVQDAVTGPDVGWSFLAALEKLDVQATNTNPFIIQLQSFDPNGSGLVTNFNATTNYAWVIATAAGGITNFSADKFIVDTSGFDNDLAGGTFSVQTNGNSLLLVFTSQPLPPVFGNVSVAGTSLIVSGAGGVTGGNYYVLASTDLTLPLTEWTRLATNQFGAGGSFSFTNDDTAGSPQVFYRLLLP